MSSMPKPDCTKTTKSDGTKTTKSDGTKTAKHDGTKAAKHDYMKTPEYEYKKSNQSSAPAPRNANQVAVTEDMPPHAQSGECYARVYLPPEFDTVTERICVREESRKVEIIPAKYEWVEERVLVKEASTQLVEVPAQYDVQDRLVQTSPGHATWVKANQARCVADTAGPPPQDIFCFVSEPPTTMTIQTERQVKGPEVKTVSVPAEYQTIRKQKLVRPASTRMVTIPAEYREIEKTVMVRPGKMEWQRVSCDSEAITMSQERRVRRVGDRNR